MSKLTEVLQKRAVKLESAIPEEIVGPVRKGQVEAGDIEEVLNRLANISSRSAVRRKLIPSSKSKLFNEHLHGYLKRYQNPLESEAYRATAEVAAPVEPKDIAATAAFNTAFPMVISRIPKIGGDPVNFGGAVNMAVGPRGFLPMTVANSVFSGLRPLGDPQWQKGNRSYLKSFHENIKGQAHNLARKSEEARDRYGLAGVPLQAVHGVMNPIASLYHGGETLYNLLMGKKGEDMAVRAESAIHEALAKRTLT